MTEVIMTSSDQRRFLVKFRVGDDCWEWQAAKNREGYGSFGLRGKMRSAHRVSYELFVGPIPAGLQIDHLCRNPSCVRPDHLEPVTPRENTMRSESWAAHKARQTHCIYGHEFTPENTYRFPDGRRSCRICRASKPHRSRAELELRASCWGRSH